MGIQELVEKGMSRHALRLFMTAAMLLFTASNLLSQSSRGTVTGLVIDISKAAVANASVDLTNENTKLIRNSTTNEAGVYRFDAVDPGSYTVKVTARGFKVAQIELFDVAAAQVKSLDAQLEIGSVTSTVDVSSEAALIQVQTPVRGGTISSKDMVRLPIASQNPVSITLTLPGVSTNRYSFGVSSFSVNGARGRSNNFMIDGTENNDISVAGQAFQITNPDAVQEVSAQTGNFDAEYGRAGGAVINTITKGGTNKFHGTARYLIEATINDAPTNLQKLDPNVLSRGHPLPGTDQYFSGTVGGPVIKNRTFFFSAYQEERQVSTSQTGLTTFSTAGRAAFLSLFPTGTNSRADFLQTVTAGSDANSQFANILVNSKNIQVGTLQRSYASTYRDRQLLERIDHSFSNADQFSIRYLYDSNLSPKGGGVGFPGFDTSLVNEVNSGLLNETHTFTPGLTNELRLGYNRIYYFFPFDPSSPLAATIRTINIGGFIISPQVLGVSSAVPQGRIANNYELQDSVSWVHGRHSFRFGTSLLDQRSKQAAPFNIRGTLSYAASTGVSGLQNYLDDFGGSGGTANHDFGSAAYYPKLFRQAYFGQDRWRATESLTITLGLRYEYFGVPINNLRTPAYTGLFNINPLDFTGPYSLPNKVKPDKNNFSPTFGLAYSPVGSNWLTGDKKLVLRGGFQIGYDSFFNNIASNAVASSPNNISVIVSSSTSTASPRGLANLSQQIPTVVPPLTPTASQTLVIGNLVNPYYMRWSGGFQRELPGQVVLDVAYVGTRGVKLFVNEDLNPLVPTGLRNFPTGYTAASFPASRLQQRYDPLQGSRLIRTNGAGSNYHALQISANRRFVNAFEMNLSYTRSKFIDNGSEIFGTGGNNLPQNTALPSIFGGLTNDRSVSLFDRPNRFALTSFYELPFNRDQHGFLGHIVGGWQLASIYTMESGAPINIYNGFDADGIGGNFDRPNYNKTGLLNVRAVPAGASTPSPTGYVDPDNNNLPIDPATAMYVVLPACIAKLPCKTGNLGRFTSRTPIQNNLDADLTKSIRISENFHLEFRGEIYNVFNHRQYGIQSISAFDGGSTTIAANAGTSLPGRFLQPGFADGGARVIKYQVKFVF